MKVHFLTLTKCYAIMIISNVFIQRAFPYFLVKILVNQPIDITKHDIGNIFHFNAIWTFNDENELIVITFKKIN